VYDFFLVAGEKQQCRRDIIENVFSEMFHDMDRFEKEGSV
jgi:hypothetical protein